MSNKIVKTNKYLAFSIGIFLILILPFINSIPYLDGNIDFLKTYDFLSGGMQLLFTNWRSIHPPFKEITATVFYNLFGVGSVSYNLVGVLFGITGIIFFYFLIRKLIGKKAAFLASLLLASWPLYVANSLFGLSDFILASLIIVSSYFYLQKKYLLYALFASLCFLTKESGILLAVAFSVTELISLICKYVKRDSIKLSFPKIVLLMVPFVTAFCWSEYLRTNNKTLWQDWNFSQSAGKGSMYTIFDNLIHLHLLNKYAYQNWLQLFVLNFNWVFWLTALAGFLLFLKKDGFRRLFTYSSVAAQKGKVIFSLCLFSLSYFLSVLSFQTYTIPRYSLPVIPFLIFLFALCINPILTRFKNKTAYFYLLIGAFTLIRLYTSVDPFSLKLWGETQVLGQKLYAAKNHLDGNDGITYNMQYLKIVSVRSTTLRSSGISPYGLYSDTCYWLFADINNDRRSEKILSLNLEPILTSCLKRR